MLNRKVPHTRFIERQIEDVRSAIGADNLLSALALALTFPDVFGRALYPDMVTANGRRNAGAQYSRWFDEHVGTEYKMPEEPGSCELERYFTGRMCWKLRCAYLHEGKSDCNYPYEPSNSQDGLDYEFEFELALHACDAVGDTTESATPDRVKRHVRIDVGKLCVRLCDAAEACLLNNAGRFSNHTSDILDLPYVIGLCRSDCQ